MKKRLLTIIAIIILSFLLIFAYSYFIGIKGLTVKERKIVNTSLPNNFHGFKIAHISDIHYGRIIDEEKLKIVVDRINVLKPDIVVLTGDLLDRDTELNEEELKVLTNHLKRIDVSIAKYAISGNHDYDYDINLWKNIVSDSDFVNLNNVHELIYNNGNTPIIISGMSSNLKDSTSISDKLKSFQNAISDKVISDIEKVKPAYSILLMHEPDYVSNFETNQFNLILAGHSHNGQVRLPFIGAIIKPDGAKKYYDEYYNIKSTNMYISSGLGTSTLDVRLFNKPSFNFYRLTNK